MITQSTLRDCVPHFLTPPEAAMVLGISLRTLHRLMKAGEIPSYRLGGLRRYREAELLAAVTSTRRLTLDEVLR